MTKEKCIKCSFSYNGRYITSIHRIERGRTVMPVTTRLSRNMFDAVKDSGVQQAYEKWKMGEELPESIMKVEHEYGIALRSPTSPVPVAFHNSHDGDDDGKYVLVPDFFNAFTMGFIKLRLNCFENFMAIESLDDILDD